MVVLRLIFLTVAAAAAALSSKSNPKFYPQKSTKNILMDFSNLLPKHMKELPVTDKKMFDNFCKETMMECAQSITNGRSAVVDIIKSELHKKFKILLENYIKHMFAVLDGMNERRVPTDNILDTVTMSQSLGYAVLEFLYDNGVAIDDVLGLYILYSDLKFICQMQMKDNKHQTIRQVVERLTNLRTEVVPHMTDKKLETKKKELLSIHVQIDMLALEVNKHPKWMTADVLKWKKLLLSKAKVKTEIGKIICEKNGLKISSWFNEIKTTVDPKKVAMFYTEVGNAIIYKVQEITEQQSYLIKDLLIVFMKSITAIDKKTDIQLLSCESADQKKLFQATNNGDLEDFKDHKCEVMESEIVKNKKRQILKSVNNEKNVIHQTYYSMVSDLKAFIDSVEFFAKFMYNDRRFSSAQFVFKTPLESMKNLHKICSITGYDQQMTNKLKTIIKELNLLEPISAKNLEKKYNDQSNRTITIDFITKNTQFMNDLNNLL